MKRRDRFIPLSGFLFLVLLLSLIWFLPCASKAEAAAQKLVIATWEPPQGTGSPVLRDWLKEIEAKSGGRIVGDISYGAMGPPPKYYDLAVGGIAHITFIAQAYTPGKFPVSDVMQLPVTGEMSAEVFSKGCWELFKKGYFDAEFKDVKVLYAGGMSPYDLHMVKGKDVRRFADMKGKKIRASGALHTKIIKLFDAVPVGMAAPEIPISMQKGVIDGQFNHLGFVKSFRSEEFTASITRIGVSSLTFVLVMNKKIYEGLPPEVKKLIEEIAPKYSALLGKAHDNMAADSAEMLKKAGAVFHNLPAEDMNEIGRIVSPLWNEWITEVEAKGVPGKKIVSDYYDIYKGLGVRNPFHGYKK